MPQSKNDPKNANRTNTGSISKCFAIPAQTPAIILFLVSLFIENPLFIIYAGSVIFPKNSLVLKNLIEIIHILSK